MFFINKNIEYHIGESELEQNRSHKKNKGFISTLIERVIIIF